MRKSITNIAELHRIAGDLHIDVDDLIEAPLADVITIFMSKVNTEAAREALRTVDELADMIIYHAKVRDNAKIMSETWEM